MQNSALREKLFGRTKFWDFFFIFPNFLISLVFFSCVCRAPPPPPTPTPPAAKMPRGYLFGKNKLYTGLKIYVQYIYTASLDNCMLVWPSTLSYLNHIWLSIIAFDRGIFRAHRGIARGDSHAMASSSVLTSHSWRDPPRKASGL